MHRLHDNHPGMLRPTFDPKVEAGAFDTLLLASLTEAVEYRRDEWDGISCREFPQKRACEVSHPRGVTP